MGVHGLWELLAPVGRRVSVETLSGKRLAIDASIWIIQFMKAMRDEKGEMVRNAHILGFFRRICKLLFLRTKPVFVFDGGTPALKRRTVIARRRQRENAQAKIRKTAEKLLLNHLKEMRLKELAADLEKQREDNNVKGKRPMTEVPSNNVSVSYNQEKFDEILAASLAAEENEGFTTDATTSGAGGKDDKGYRDEEEDDEDEEMILPEMHGKVDPAVLAALPPSMQLDLLVQMRERLMAENRQKYQKVKKAPSRFSELQIESYLKTVAFRREIDGVQKAASGRGIGGIQTSRIASEANREYIFSSSFTGDKQAFTSLGQESSEANQSRAPPKANCSTRGAINEIISSSSRRSVGVAAGPAAVAESGKNASYHEDIETYRDERGRIRVSRGRALGIHMTRDLQRNLDLMKEIDREKNNSEPISAGNPVDKNNDVVNGNSMEITFEDMLGNENGNDDDDDDDNIFAHLVAGGDQSLVNNVSDNEWEEGVIENKGVIVNEGEEVEWEDGYQDYIELKSSSSRRDESEKNATKGALEEEANIEEAIRRSLEDTMNNNHENNVILISEEEQGPGIEASAADVSPKTVTTGAMEEEVDIREAIKLSLEEKSGQKSMSDFQENDCVISDNNINEWEQGPEIEASAADVSPKTVTTGVMEEEVDIREAIKMSLEEKSGQKSMSDLQENDCIISDNDINEWEEGPGIEADVSQLKSTHALLESNSAEFVELNIDVNNLKLLHQDGDGHAVDELVGSSSILSSSLTDSQQMFQAALDDRSCRTAEIEKVSTVDWVTDVDGTDELVKEKIYDDFSMEKDEVARSSSFFNDDKDRETMEDRLEEEMIFLGKERVELGNEQRKLERNSESVSSEMFAECQELLQMFGLPYIIAPMEAEAQCAFMELTNLVDGVVTEDSDAFLFGARSVYKNIFDDRKYVETYFMKDIESELGLDREKLVHMALLLGSDYTEGISGIGIVNAIEVVNAFPSKDGLREFREWIESPDPSILGKLHAGKSRGKGSKGNENKMSVSRDQPDGEERIKQIFMDKHRNLSKNWNFSSSFPSDAVISAYISPQVDKSTESLAWGKPDLFVLRKLCWEKFGWGASKADELLLPVLKEYNKHETQLRLEAFYTFNERFAKIRSKRITKAVKQITKHKSSELMDEATPQQPGSGRKRKAKSSKDEDDQSGVGTNINETTERPKRGRAKSRGRGRRQTSGRGKRKNNSSRADTEIDSSESDEEMQLDELEESRRVRRSGRPRKTVNYNVSDEFEDSDKEKNEDRLKEVSSAEDESFVDQMVGSRFNQDNNGNGLTQEGCDDDVEIGDRNFVDNTEETYKMDNPSANLVDNQFDENPKESELSKEYLQFGGGFCADDEDEEMETTTERVSSPINETIIPEKSDGPNIDTRLSDDEKTDLGFSEVSLNKETQCVNEIENDLGDHYSKSLRSMPNLRRKKKRN